MLSVELAISLKEGLIVSFSSGHSYSSLVFPSWEKYRSASQVVVQIFLSFITDHLMALVMVGCLFPVNNLRNVKKLPLKGLKANKVILKQMPSSVCELNLV